VVDFVSVDRCHLVGDPPDRGKERLVAVDCDGHAAWACSSPTAAAIPATLSNTLRLSIWSGNSMSNDIVERQHHADAGVRAHPSLKQVRAFVERVDDWEPCVVA
jgi:hypothetical protein